MADQLALTRPSRSALTPNPNRAVRQQIPAFLNKLYSMVNDPANSELIRWSDEGDSFFVPNHERFGRELLPRFFKHGNFSSFVRQLNMYGFHKVPHLQQGVLQNETETELWQFVNPHFQRGQKDLLMLIQRKKAGTITASAGGGEEEDSAAGPSHTVGDHPALPSSSHHPSTSQAVDISTIAQSLSAIKRHQSTISSDLKDLQQSNTALWQEAVAARERHKKHQDTINRILKFLAGVFGTAAGGAATPGGIVSEHDGSPGGPSGGSPSRKGSVALIPRKRPRLMIEDSGSNSDLRQKSSNGLKGKGKAVPDNQRMAHETEDAEWANEHLMVPMDLAGDDATSTSSARIAEMPSPLDQMENSSLWEEESPPAARIESVASTPHLAVPPTPFLAPIEKTGSSAPSRQTDAAPTGQGILFPATLGTQSSTFSLAGQATTSPITPSQVYPYFNAQQTATNQDAEASEPPPSFDMNPSDQAAFQALMNSPNGLHRMMAALAQPGGLPSLPPMSNPAPHNGLQYMYPGAPTPAFDLGSTFNPQQNQLITTGANSMGYGTPFPMMGSGYDAPTVNGAGDAALSPDAVLALLSGPGGNNGIGNSANGIGPTDQEIANTMNSHTNTLNRTYTDATAINNDVDALQQSIQSLMQSMGLDPATMSKLHEDEVADGSLGSGGENLAGAEDAGQSVDFDAFLHQLGQDAGNGLAGDQSSGLFNADGTFAGAGDGLDFDASSQSGTVLADDRTPTQENGVYPEEAGTPHTASTPEAKDDVADASKGNGTRTRSAKRKSSANDANEVQGSPGTTRARKSSRRK